jgi:sigma-B regulation protein RsbU (phosphoserine phosphatase)
MVGHVAATGKMHYAPDVTRDPYYVACEPDTRSEVAIPLQREGDLVGVFTASHCELNAFCPDQLRLLQALCSHVAVAVHNARRFGDEREQRERLSREAEEARSIQQALLPRSSPLIPGFRVSGLSIPAGSVGGDWYDFIPLQTDAGAWFWPMSPAKEPRRRCSCPPPAACCARWRKPAPDPPRSYASQ